MTEISAGDWMRQNGHDWKKRKPRPGGKDAKLNSAQYKRSRRVSKKGRKRIFAESIRDFCDGHSGHLGDDCLFVPASQKGTPAQVKFFNKTISAARYMLLITQGTAKWGEAFVTHKCGNGHLSCVNPKHLQWGDPSTNRRDEVLHRGCETVADKVRAIEERD